jgi:hypothetical protein
MKSCCSAGAAFACLLALLPWGSSAQDKPATLAQDLGRLKAGTWVKERVEGKVTYRVVLTFGSGPGLGPDAYKDISLSGSEEAVVGNDIDSERILWGGSLVEEKGKRFLNIARAGRVFYSFEKGKLRLTPAPGVEALKSLSGEYTLKKEK